MKNELVPRLALFGFCDRYEEVREGSPAFWKRNVMGITQHLLFYVFPASLRNIILALVIHNPKNGDNFHLIFKKMDDAGTIFDLNMSIKGIVSIQATNNTLGLEEHSISQFDGWMLMPNKIDALKY